MRNPFYLLVVLILSCLCSYNLDAKVIDYLGHRYDGIVVNKAPQGYGTMTFDGFTIEGTFNGNKVTDAHITVGDFEVGYEGTLTYNESQKVILKADGTLTADVYEYTDITSDHMVRGVVTKFPLRKETKKIEKVLEDKVVGADYFNVDKFTWYLPIDLTEKSIVPKELNPSVLMRPITVTDKIRIRYPEEALESDGTIPIWKPWKEDDKAAIEYEVSESLKGVRKENFYGRIRYWMKCRNPKTKTIFVCDFKYNERTRTHNVANKKGNAYGDKDEQGRIWYCDESNYYVQCLNGDFYSYAGGGQVKCKATLPNNVIITSNSRQYDVKYTVLDENKKEIATLVQSVNNDILTKLFASACAGKTDVLPKWNLDSHERMQIANASSLTREQVRDLLENNIFLRFDIEKDEAGNYKTSNNASELRVCPDEMKGYGSYLKMESGIYFIERKEYVPYDEIQAKYEAQKAEERRLKREEIDKFIAKLMKPYVKYYGIDPLEYTLGTILEPGTSFKILNAYFNTRHALYDMQIRGQSYIEYEYPGIPFMRLSVSGLNENILTKYYYLELTSNSVSSQCYDIWSDRLGYKDQVACIWVSNDKITSVYWY